MIRILFGVYADKVNAQNINCFEIAKRLNKSKFEVHMFYCDKRPNTVDIIYHKASSNRLVKNLMKFLITSIYNYDVIYLPRVEKIDKILARFYRNKKNIVSSIEIENALHNPSLKRFFCKNISSFFAINYELKKCVKDSWGIDVPVLYLGYNRCDIKTEPRTELKKIGFVGSFIDRKKPQHVIYLAKQFPKIQFVLIGEGPLRKNLENDIRDGDLRNVKILGGLPNDEVYKQLVYCDLLIITSDNEGQPKVSLEAASLGVPTCYIRNNYKIDYVYHEKTGFEVQSLQEMKETIEKLYQMPKLLHDVSKKVKMAVSNLSWDQLIEDYEKYFESVSAKTIKKSTNNNVYKKIFYKLDKLTQMKLYVLKHNIIASKKRTLPFDGFLSENLEVLNDTFRTNEYRLSNDFYGIANTLKNYVGRKKSLKAFIEHGVYFGEYTNPEETGYLMPMLITFGSARKKHIQKQSNIHVLCVGPYIAYAESYFDKEKMDILKNKYGKILLAFPQHTIEGISLSGECDNFIKKLFEIKNRGRFDSIFVCLYYKDVNQSIIEYYKKNKIIPVCAGNRQDPNFLSRLKSFILLSDFTVSDNIGTHIGYCETLGRKHLVFQETSKLIAENEQVKKNVPELYMKSSAIEKMEVRRAFSTLDDTKARDEVLKKYWGTDKIKEKENLRRIFEFCDECYKRGIRDEQNIQTLIETKYQDIQCLLEETRSE